MKKKYLRGQDFIEKGGQVMWKPVEMSQGNVRRFRPWNLSRQRNELPLREVSVKFQWSTDWKSDLIGSRSRLQEINSAGNCR